MTTVRELLTKWGFEANTKPIDKLNKSLSDVKTTVTLIGAQAIAQVGALFGLTNAVASVGDEYAKTSKRIGVNVETLQEYSHVAGLAAMSSQEMTGAIESLTLSISEARKGGGKLIEPLIRLNQLTGKDLLTNLGNADDTILKLADTFAGMSDATEKAELANKIFGGSGIKMINVLNQGSAAIIAQRNEARELGVVLSSEVAARSEMFKDSLLRVKSAILGVRNIVGAELMPTVIEYMDLMKKWILRNKEWIKGNITKFVKGLIDSTKTLIFVTSKIIRVISSAIQSFGGLERVIKTVLVAMSLLAGVKFLSGIGNLTMAISSGLILAFKALGNVALLAQAKMLLVPIAIGAAIAAVLLILEDIVAFFQGRNSITGKIVKAFKGVDIAGLIRNKLDQAINVIREFSTKVQTYLGGLFEFPNLQTDIAEAVKGALTTIQKLFEDFSFKGFGEKLAVLISEAFQGDNIIGKIIGLFATIFQAIGDALLLVLGGIISTAIEAIKGALAGALDFSGGDGTISKIFDAFKNFDPAKSLFGIGADTQANLNAVGAGAGGAGVKPDLKLIPGGASQTSTTINNNQVTVPVTIPPGTDPKKGSAMVEDGIKSALEKMARETQAATGTNVEM